MSLCPSSSDTHLIPTPACTSQMPKVRRRTCRRSLNLSHADCVLRAHPGGPRSRHPRELCCHAVRSPEAKTSDDQNQRLQQNLAKGQNDAIWACYRSRNRIIRDLVLARGLSAPSARARRRRAPAHASRCCKPIAPALQRSSPERFYLRCSFVVP